MPCTSLIKLSMLLKLILHTQTHSRIQAALSPPAFQRVFQVIRCDRRYLCAVCCLPLKANQHQYLNILIQRDRRQRWGCNCGCCTDDRWCVDVIVQTYTIYERVCLSGAGGDGKRCCCCMHRLKWAAPAYSCMTSIWKNLAATYLKR